MVDADGGMTSQLPLDFFVQAPAQARVVVHIIIDKAPFEARDARALQAFMASYEHDTFFFLYGNETAQFIGAERNYSCYMTLTPYIYMTSVLSATPQLVFEWVGTNGDDDKGKRETGVSEPTASVLEFIVRFISPTTPITNTAGTSLSFIEIYLRRFRH
jgi:hypothetical protein